MNLSLLRAHAALAVLVASFALAPAAVRAQCSASLATTLAGGNQGADGGQVFFDLTVTGSSPIVVCSLSCRVADSGAFLPQLSVYTRAGSYVGNTSNPSAWSLATTGVATSPGAGPVVEYWLPSPVIFAPGTHGVSLIVSPGTAHEYTNGNGANQSYANDDIAITCGAAKNVPWSGALLSPRVWNGVVVHTPGTPTSADVFGLHHVALGGASVQVQAGTGFCSIGSIGASGADGVAITTGGVSNLIAELGNAPASYPIGSSIAVTSIGSYDGGPQQTLCETYAYRGASDWVLAADLSALGRTEYAIEVYDGEQLVYSAIVPNNSTFLAADAPSGWGAGGPAGLPYDASSCRCPAGMTPYLHCLNGVGNCGSWYYWDASKAQCCANAGGWVVCGCTAKAGIAFNWHVATIVQVNGFSGLATLLRIGDMAVGDSLLSRAELRFSGPTSVAIENESVDFGSVRASAFGSVTSSSGAGAIHLAPSSPTASGGVRLDLPNHAASAAIALAPIAAASTGGFLDVESEGSIAGAPHALGRVRLAPASSQVACTADFSAVGATDSQITVLDQGAVIAQVASSSLASPALLDAAPSIIVIWSSGGGIHARFEGVVNVLLGVSSFAGDEVRFAPIGASLSSASLTSATLTMSGLTGLDLARADVATADPAPQSYCTAGTGGNGCQAHVSSSGRPSVSSADEFFVTFIGVEGQRTGVVFYGTSGPHAAPWAPGSSSFLCVKAPTQRTGSQSSGGTTGACDGALAFSWHDYWPVHSTALGAPFVPGEQLYFQAWYRDPTAVKTTSLSDGLEVTLQP